MTLPAQDITEYIRQILLILSTWPVVFLFCAIIFRKPLQRLIGSLASFVEEIDEVKIKDFHARKRVRGANKTAEVIENTISLTFDKRQIHDDLLNKLLQEYRELVKAKTEQSHRTIEQVERTIEQVEREIEALLDSSPIETMGPEDNG